MSYRLSRRLGLAGGCPADRETDRQPAGLERVLAGDPARRIPTLVTPVTDPSG
jgi:hypothetical protein